MVNKEARPGRDIMVPYGDVGFARWEFVLKRHPPPQGLLGYGGERKKGVEFSQNTSGGKTKITTRKNKSLLNRDSQKGFPKEGGKKIKPRTKRLTVKKGASITTKYKEVGKTLTTRLRQRKKKVSKALQKNKKPGLRKRLGQ